MIYRRMAEEIGALHQAGLRFFREDSGRWVVRSVDERRAWSAVRRWIGTRMRRRREWTGDEAGYKSRAVDGT